MKLRYNLPLEEDANRRKRMIRNVVTRARGMALLAVAVLLALSVASCKTGHAPPAAPMSKEGASSATGVSVEAPAAVTTAVKPDGDEERGTAPGVVSKADGEGAGAEAVQTREPGEDKDLLWECYREVYCAQKKGEMAKILDIYKKHGFETPQEFTRAWIEAAKDTEWVSKLAHDVSKSCK